MAVNIFKLRSTILIRPLARPKYRALGNYRGNLTRREKKGKKAFLFLVLLP